MSNEKIVKTARLYALQNAVQFSGKANPKAVVGKVIAVLSKDGISPKDIVPVVESVVTDVNKLSLEEQTAELQRVAPELLIKEKKEIEDNLLKFLDILDENNKKVLMCLIENKGELSQSKLTKILESNKVKISRIVARMEEKGIIKKEKNGMTNKIIHNDELKELFVK